MIDSVRYSITFASRTKQNYVFTETQIANKFVSLDFYVAALCNLGFKICVSYIEQVWPPLVYAVYSLARFVIADAQAWQIVEFFFVSTWDFLFKPGFLGDYMRFSKKISLAALDLASIRQPLGSVLVVIFYKCGK